MHYGLLSADKAKKEHFDPREFIDIDSDEEPPKVQIKSPAIEAPKAIIPLLNSPS